MPYAEIYRKGKVIAVSFEPKGWEMPYNDLRAQTPISLYAMAALEGKNNFDNDFARTMQGLYDRRIVNRQELKETPFGLITRDIIREGGRGVNDKGRLHLRVTSFDGMRGWQKTRYVWSPKSGYPVPTGDSDGTFAGLFQEGTLVAVETLPFGKRDKAKERWEAAGLDPEYLSGYYVEERIDQSLDDGIRFGSRVFNPDLDDLGRFVVDLDRLPSPPGSGRVASLPPAEPAMRIEF